MKIADARQLPPAAQESLRTRCVEAVRSGMTQTAAAVLFDVARGTVSRWVKLVEAAGTGALASKPRGGDRCSKLTATGYVSNVLQKRVFRPKRVSRIMKETTHEPEDPSRPA